MSYVASALAARAADETHNPSPLHYHHEASGAGDMPTELTGKPVEPASSGRRPNALIVDDDQAILWLSACILEQAGFKVWCATDGNHALSQISSGEIDVVITDLVMPNMDGIELIGILRKQDPLLPVVAISGAFGGGFLDVALKLGARAALHKPFTPELLITSVMQVLNLHFPKPRPDRSR